MTEHLTQKGRHVIVSYYYWSFIFFAIHFSLFIPYHFFAILCQCVWIILPEIRIYSVKMQAQNWLGRLFVENFSYWDKRNLWEKTHKRERKKPKPNEDEKPVVVFCLSIPHSFCMVWQKFGLAFVLNSVNFFPFLTIIGNS